MRLPTISEINAGGRHVVTFATGMITMAAIFNVITADQADVLKASLPKIIQAFGELSAALTPVVGIVSAWFAMRSASPQKQIEAVAANPSVAQITVKDPVVAGAIPSEKVVMASPEGNGGVP